MRQAIAFGPFVFSLPLILVFGSLGLGFAVGSVLNGTASEQDKRLLFIAFVIALLAARAAYVIEWFGIYVLHPIDILDIRDGGWNIPLGLLIAVLYLMSLRRARVDRPAPRLKPAFSALAVAMVAYAGGSAAARLVAPPLTDRQVMSSIELTGLDGAPVGLARFEGRATVVNLWATWCGPCRREMPMLARAQGANADIHFVFANQGETAARVSAYLAAEHLAPANVLLDGKSEMARASDARGWPTTVYLDADGRIIESDTGELTPTKLAQRLVLLRSGVPEPRTATGH